MAKKFKILVVENEITNSILLKGLLIKNDYEVTLSKNGEEALSELSNTNFDAIVTDWMIPILDGIGLINRVGKSLKDVPLILMVTALVSEQSKAYTMDSGADIFIGKPFDGEVLINELKNGLNIKHAKRPNTTISGDLKIPETLPDHVGVGITASTGGPPALIELIENLDKKLNCSYFLVQHGPDWMLKTFADRLEQHTGMNTELAKNDMKVKKGTLYVAPGDYHMHINSDLRISLTKTEKENYVRPAADLTFRSIAEVYGKKSMGIVLTGLGKDGTNGMEAIKKAGGKLIVQSPETSTAPFMPRSVIKTIPDAEVFDLNVIAEKIKSISSEINKY